jgi:hypothetical protein
MCINKEMDSFYSFIKSVPGGEKLTKQHLCYMGDCAETLGFEDKEPFCEQGSPCEMIGFMHSGFFKTSCLKKNIPTIMDMNFIGYNRIISDLSSMVTGADCKSSILSVHKSMVVCFSKVNWESLYDKIPLLNGISRHLTIMSRDTKSIYMGHNEGMNAKDTLIKFIKDYPLAFYNLNKGEVKSYLNLHRNSGK